ncbi:sugar phosphate nucleotidyltransferase [Opitutales bacterium]|nr:sugar phosphate nucleotidyltransferase [Opitutales bacterium]
MSGTVHCVIMGGGRGTRLHPLTQLRCKPAVPLAGKYRLVDVPISNCINSGFNRIYLLSQFNTASLHRHVQHAYRFDRFAGGFVEILSAEQTEISDTWYQGTADAVRRNLMHFHAEEDDIFIILSGDQLFRMDLAKMVEEHRERGADVTVAANPVSISEAPGLGLIRVGDNAVITEFVEKPTNPEVIRRLVPPELAGVDGTEDRCLASMGIYVFGAKELTAALATDSADFGKEIIPGLVGRRDLRCHIFDDYWEDIGTVRAFFDANLQLTDPVPAFDFYDEESPIYNYPDILPTAKLTESYIDRAIVASGAMVGRANLTRCVLGVRSIVADGCKLENVVMMGADHYERDFVRVEKRDRLGLPALGVGENSTVTNAIIDKNARIGKGVRLSPEGCEDGWVDESKGLFVRDGVLVVLKNAVVPDGTVAGGE